jgi:hypothetical protein
MAIQTTSMNEVCGENTIRPWIDSGYVGDFAVRPMKARFGLPHEGHAHWIDHLTVILKGPVRIEWNDPTTGEAGNIDVLVTPWFLNIPAERWHRFVPLTEAGAEWVCIFSGAYADARGVKRKDFDYERLTHG